MSRNRIGFSAIDASKAGGASASCADGGIVARGDS